MDWVGRVPPGPPALTPRGRSFVALRVSRAKQPGRCRAALGSVQTSAGCAASDERFSGPREVRTGERSVSRRSGP
jgi:hypothetical protein